MPRCLVLEIKKLSRLVTHTKETKKLNEELYNICETTTSLELDATEQRRKTAALK